METARYIAHPEELEKVGHVDRIYTGNEFCEFRLPSQATLAKLIETEIPITLATSLVTDDTITRIEALAIQLTQSSRDSEIVVNDLGVLTRIAPLKGITPVLGRLLSRNLLDQHMNNLMATSSEGFNYFRNHYQIGRLEISNCGHRFSIPDRSGLQNMQLSLHFPFHFLTTSRQCIFRYHNAAPTVRCDSQRCSQKYSDTLISFNYPDFIEERLYLKGNTVFKAYKNFPYNATQLAKMGVDRLVITPKKYW